MSKTLVKTKNAYELYKREFFLKQVWQITKKCLIWIGIGFVFAYYTIFYFIKICLGGE